MKDFYFLKQLRHKLASFQDFVGECCSYPGRDDLQPTAYIYDRSIEIPRSG